MQTLKHTSVIRVAFQILFFLSAITLLFSCSKDNNLSTAAKANQISPTVSEKASAGTNTAAVPYEKTFYVPCANGGAGEYVRVKGSTNIVYTISWTDHGFTYGYHANTYKIEGVGLTSGETFIGSGHTEGQVMGAWVNEQWLSTLVDQVKLIGKSTSFVVKNTYHITVSPDGTEQIKINDSEVSCN